MAGLDVHGTLAQPRAARVPLHCARDAVTAAALIAAAAHATSRRCDG
jgi:hypothetical protein